MTLRIERAPAFWQAVAQHPLVAPNVMFEEDMGWDFVEQESVVPLASEHGGFLFVRLDAIGRVCELHTLFTPEGWGHEVSSAAKEAFAHVFGEGFQMVVTMEVSGNAKSQPPKSFGWKPCGGFETVKILDRSLKSWFLTLDAWNASPAKKRFDRQCL